MSEAPALSSVLATAAKLACSDIYDPITPNVFSKIYRVGETVCGIVLVAGTLYVVNQGTENMAGWKEDFTVEPIFHPVLGNIHSGFDKNLPALVALLMRDIPAGMSVVVCGHSKGAGEGALLAARLNLAGINVIQAILFACPNAGHQQFADWMQATIPGLSFRNAPKYVPCFGDPVPMVPEYPSVPPYPHNMINVVPAGMSRLLNIEWHLAEYYLNGVQT